MTTEFLYNTQVDSYGKKELGNVNFNLVFWIILNILTKIFFRSKTYNNNFSIDFGMFKLENRTTF